MFMTLADWVTTVSLNSEKPTLASAFCQRRSSCMRSGSMRRRSSFISESLGSGPPA